MSMTNQDAAIIGVARPGKSSRWPRHREGHYHALWWRKEAQGIAEAVCFRGDLVDDGTDY